MDDIERFFSHVEITPTCWNWKAAIRADGYGKWATGGRDNQRNWRAHRFSYELLKGKIPDGLDLDHLCRNRRCVNPAHLEPVTRRENVIRGIRVNKDHCIHGHLYSTENTYIRKNGHRQCRVCGKIAARKTRRKSTDGKARCARLQLIEVVK